MTCYNDYESVDLSVITNYITLKKYDKFRICQE